MEENMIKGFVKIYRSLMDWEWYTEPETSHLFVHLIMKANYKDKKWKGKEVKRGSLITSLKHLSQSTGLSITKVRTALKRLKNSGAISIISTNKYTMVRLLNFDVYQEIYHHSDKQIPHKNQKDKTQTSTTKEIKKKNKIKNERNGERMRTLSNFDYLNEFFHEELKRIIKDYPLAEKQLEFCINKFNTKKYENLNIGLFENYLSNWINNIKQETNLKLSLPPTFRA
ncbi:hypothetical protein [Flagellimonas sp.]|uniref:hypothetical protein n=1 Tax=Flagellimonas sp. TaxID=2058762 RepID=UPI003F4A2F57